MGESLEPKGMNVVAKCVDSLRNLGALFTLLGMLLLAMPLYGGAKGPWLDEWMAVAVTVLAFGLMYIATSVLVGRRRLWAIEAARVMTYVLILGSVAFVVWSVLRKGNHWMDTIGGVAAVWTLVTEIRDMRAAREVIRNSVDTGRGFEVVVKNEDTDQEKKKAPDAHPEL